jgi:hypothetical protein
MSVRSDGLTAEINQREHEMTGTIARPRQATHIVLLAALLLGPVTPVSAQNGLNVGDRIHRPDSTPSGDDKGTIKEIGTGRNEGCQLVLWDKVAKYEPDHPGHWLCTYGVKNIVFLIDANGRHVRDINGPAANAPDVQAAPVARNTAPPRGRAAPPAAKRPGTPQGGAEETAAAALCSGQPLVNFSSKGRGPSAALFGDVIRSQRDVAPTRTTLKTVTTIQSLTVEKARPWRLEDNGLQRLGLAKTVYPIRVSFTTCVDADLTWNIAVSKNYPYVCYKDDGSGEWTCTLSSGTGDSRESRQVKKQAFYDFTGQQRQ